MSAGARVRRLLRHAAAAAMVASTVAAGGSAVDAAATDEGTTERRIDAASGAQRAQAQTISLTVEGGALTASPSTVTVELGRHRGHGRYVGQLPTITVVDARGSLVGWTLGVAVTGDQRDREHLQIRPGEPVATTGIRSEVRTGRPARLGARSVPVLIAPSGGGGGMFEISPTLELHGGGRGRTDTVTVELAITIR